MLKTELSTFPDLALQLTTAKLAYVATVGLLSMRLFNQAPFLPNSLPALPTQVGRVGKTRQWLFEQYICICYLISILKFLRI